MIDLLRKLPFWLVQTVWILLLVGAFGALAYAIWYMVERREAKRPKVRGFEVKPSTGEPPVPREREQRIDG